MLPGEARPVISSAGPVLLGEARPVVYSAEPGCYLGQACSLYGARVLPGQARHVPEAGSYFGEIYAGLPVCSKNWELDCKRQRKNNTTVLQFLSTSPTANFKIKHKKKHKPEHNKSTRIAQLFCNLEHQPNHKLQNQAQEKAQKTRAQQKAQE